MMQQTRRNMMQLDKEMWQTSSKQSAAATTQAVKTTSATASLQEQLQCEADKIRKWKLKTEIDIKQKSSQLDQQQKQLTVVTKSLTEAQLNNESLKLKLKEETSTREVLLKRVETTREMCFALKSHLISLTEQMAACENEKEILHKKEATLCDNYETLISKFSALKLEQEQAKGKFEETIQCQQQEFEQCRIDLEKQLGKKEAELLEHQENVQQKSEELKCAEEDLKHRILEIEDLTKHSGVLKEDLEKAGGSCKSLELDVSALKENLEFTKESLSEKTVEFDQVSKELEELKIRLTDLEKSSADESRMLEEKNNHLTNNLAESEQKLSEAKASGELLQNDYNETLEALKDLNKVYGGLKEEKEDLSEKLKTLQDQYVDKVQELHESSLKVTDTQSQLNEITAKFEKSESSLQETTNSLNNLQSHHDELEGNLTSSNTELKEIKELLDNKKELYGKLLTEKENLEAVLSQTQEEHKQTNASLQACQEQLLETNNQLSTTERNLEEQQLECKQLQETVVKYKSDLESKETELAEALENLDVVSSSEDKLRQELGKMQSEFQGESELVRKQLNEEKAQVGELSKHLENKDSRVTEVQSKLKEARVEAQTLKKDIKQKEKEIKKLSSLSTKMEVELTELKGKCDGLSEDNKDLNMAFVVVNGEVDNHLSTIKQLSEDFNSATTENQNLHQENENLSQKLHSLKIQLDGDHLLFEQKMESMAAANSKSIQEKEDHIQVLTAENNVATAQIGDLKNNINDGSLRIEQLQEENHDLKVQMQSRINTLQNELECTKTTAAIASQENDKLQCDLNDKRQSCTMLSNQLACKEKELKDLMQAVQGLKTKATAVATPLPHNKSNNPSPATRVSAIMVHQLTPFPKRTSSACPVTPRNKTIPLGLIPETPVSNNDTLLAEKTPLTPKTPRSCLKSIGNLIPSCEQKKTVNFNAVSGEDKENKVVDSESDESGSVTFEVQVPKNPTPKKSTRPVKGVSRPVTPLLDKSISANKQHLKLGPKEYKLLSPDNETERLPRSRALQNKLQKTGKLGSSYAEENPSKSPGKFFKSGISLGQKHKNKSKSSFNMDSVFGFDG